MSYTTLDGTYHFNIEYDAAATSSGIYRFIPSGTTSKSFSLHFTCDIPDDKTPKSKSRWVDKKLKKLGRATKATLGARSGNQYWLK